MPDLGLWTVLVGPLIFLVLCGLVMGWHSLFGDDACFEREQRRFERDMLSRKRD